MISFLIAVHNEEKIIDKTLKNLLSLPYIKYEVLIGLDGCTDNTENIVKKYSSKSKIFKYFNLNLRSGKPVVIDFLIKKSKGDIIVIQDADWVFNYTNEKNIKEFFGVFNDRNHGLPAGKNRKALEVLALAHQVGGGVFGVGAGAHFLRSA